MVASVARLREAPDKTSKVVTTLRVGTEVRIDARAAGGFVKVRTEVASGYVPKRLLSTTRPTFEHWAKVAQKSTGRTKLNAWLRAVGLRPADEKAIAAMTKMFAAQGNKKAAHMGEKGLIAAERRNLSWDGPLYPIIGGRAYVPLPCPAGALVLTEDRTTLRGRAFPLVASGKVVSVTEQGYTTQTLSAPVCTEGGQLAFDLPKPAQDGALVPSWTVAGFDVVPFSRYGDAHLDAQGLYTVERAQGGANLSRKGFDGRYALLGTLYGDEYATARPVAQFSEDERAVYVLFLQDGAPRACGVPVERRAWLVRVWRQGKPGTVETGRVYVSHLIDNCEQPRFLGLEGEPRCARLPEGCELTSPKLAYPAWLSPEAKPSSGPVNATTR